MKFIESTNFFVRTIMFDFVNRDERVKLKFRLAPMFHIGTKAYYETVLNNIRECDEIFYEGIKLVENDDPFYKRIGLKHLGLKYKQYKSIAKKLDLVTQSEFFNLKEIKDKLTHCDYNRETGAKAWDELRFIEKIRHSLINPFLLFVYHQGISREILAKHLMTSSEEAYLAYGPIEDEKGSSRNFIMNEREQIVFKQIRNKVEVESNLDKTIGIIYGAGHMESIARYLIDHYKYTPRNGKFVKVFNVHK